jgi:hypothetical protein
MAIHILTVSPDAIDFHHAALRAGVEATLGRAVEVYRPHTFVEHSGFSETVREEIQLVFDNSSPRQSFEAFVASWGLGPHLDRRVLELSGGWRKFLGLALFFNRPIRSCLLFDATSHLSDARVRVLLQQAAEMEEAVFAEYDPTLLALGAAGTHLLESLDIGPVGGAR